MTKFLAVWWNTTNTQVGPCHLVPYKHSENDKNHCITRNVSGAYVINENDSMTGLDLYFYILFFNFLVSQALSGNKTIMIIVLT